MSKKHSRFGTITIPTETYKDVRAYVYDATAALGLAVTTIGTPAAALSEMLQRISFAQVHAGASGAHDGVVVGPSLGRALSTLGIKYLAGEVRIPRD